MRVLVVVLASIGLIAPTYAMNDNVIEVATSTKPLAINLEPHRALYEISLKDAKSSSGIADIEGQMYYDLKETCDYWESTHRFVMLYNYVDSPPSQVTSEFKTKEAKQGSFFEFSVSRIRDGIVQEDITGRTREPITSRNGTFPVSFSAPEEMTLDIVDKAIFPVRHSINILNKAAAGKKFVKATVFDGSDTQGAFVSSGVILKPVSEPERKRIWPKDVDTDLARAPGWRTQMAIFPLSQEDENAEAEYEIDMNLLINGVVTDLSVRYPDFAIRQSLQALSPYRKPQCDVDDTAKELQTDS